MFEQQLREECRIFQMVRGIVGDLGDPEKNLRSGNAMDRGLSSLTTSSARLSHCFARAACWASAPLRSGAFCRRAEQRASAS
jgi:hypothetical protein